MRKVVLFVHISLNGYAAGPNGELDWISYDEELRQFAAEWVGKVGSPMYGRLTYRLMESYWPTVLDNPDSDAHDRAHAQWLNDATKIVFSRTMETPTWQNTLVIRDNIAEEVAKLKEQPGNDLVVFGSPGLAQTLFELDLVDELWLTLNPVLLAAGTPLFRGLKGNVPLRLLEAKTLVSGVIGLRYETIRK